jgi:hypothetical protein
VEGIRVLITLGGLTDGADYNEKNKGGYKAEDGDSL